MSDSRTVAEALRNLADTTQEVDALRAGIELLVAHPERALSDSALQELHDDAQAQAAYTELVYALEAAEIWIDDALDQRKFDAAVGGAKTLVASPTKPENDVVVNVPEGDNPELGQSLGSLVVRLTDLLHETDKELVILNPFFTEHAFSNTVYPVVSALQRGVSVTLITRYLTYGDDGDAREFVRRLQAAAQDGNLACYEYIDPDEHSNATLHAKMVVSDRTTVYMGTANLTHRGLRDNLEVGVIFRDDTATQLVQFTDELQASKYIHPVELKNGEFVRQ